MTTFTDGTTAGVVTTELHPNVGIKMIQVRVPDTFVWGADSIVVDLKDYGATKIAGVVGFEETTAGSIVNAVDVATATTAVADGVLTYVSDGAGTNGGTIIIYAY